MTRPRPQLLARIAVPLVAAALAIAIPAAQAATHSGAGVRAPAPSTTRSAAKAVQGELAPLAGLAPRSAAATAKAVTICAGYAAQAGWANNGYYGGDLVTAATLCVAESGGNAKLFVCDKNGSEIGHGNYPPVKCPTGTTSYDRGLWQLNNVADSAVHDTCAFNAVCNAGSAYLASDRGTNFSPWSTYDNDTYTTYLDLTQGAVSALKSGTVTSAELGECLTRRGSRSGTPVVIENCGSGAASEQWAPGGGKLKSGGLCASVGSGAGVVLRGCANVRAQGWRLYGTDELRNTATGKCLTDPSGSLASGTKVIVARCTGAKDQIWWLL